MNVNKKQDMSGVCVCVCVCHRNEQFQNTALVFPRRKSGKSGNGVIGNELGLKLYQSQCKNDVHYILCKLKRPKACPGVRARIEEAQVASILSCWKDAMIFETRAFRNSKERCGEEMFGNRKAIPVQKEEATRKKKEKDNEAGESYFDNKVEAVIDQNVTKYQAIVRKWSILLVLNP